MPPQGTTRGMKNPGMPPIVVARFAYQWLAQGPAIGATDGARRTLSQNSRSRGRRSSNALPAMIAPLMAPIEVPITQSGSTPASCSAWYTPSW